MQIVAHATSMNVETSLDPKRRAWLQDMASHVLQHGLRDASLRPLAKAAGTSDRMLIYHFASKDGVISALLLHLAQSLTAHLDLALPEGRAETARAVVEEVRALMQSDMGQGYMRLWFDILSVAAQGDGPHRQAGHVLSELFEGWLQKRLPDPTQAEAVLTLFEGVLVMDALDLSARGDAALDLLD